MLTVLAPPSRPIQLGNKSSVKRRRRIIRRSQYSCIRSGSCISEKKTVLKKFGRNVASRWRRSGTLLCQIYRRSSHLSTRAAIKAKRRRCDAGPLKRAEDAAAQTPEDMIARKAPSSQTQSSQPAREDHCVRDMCETMTSEEHLQNLEGQRLALLSACRSPLT